MGKNQALSSVGEQSLKQLRRIGAAYVWVILRAIEPPTHRIPISPSNGSIVAVCGKVDCVASGADAVVAAWAGAGTSIKRTPTAGGVSGADAGAGGAG
jgi:hypothetical protein